jgi:molybdopterin-guanine dinucleotide biosynthesis adapter protein
MSLKIVAIVGLSGTGKTLLMTRLIAELKRRGFKVFAVKHGAHGFSLDPEGKDTRAFAEAGAARVAMVSPEDWAVLSREPGAGLMTVVRRFSAGADIALVEGGKGTAGIRKIEVLRAGVSGAALTPPDDLLAVVTDGPSGPAGVPAFSPAQTAALCDRILTLEEEPMAEIKLEVDGKKVPLNPFVRSFIEKTVIGMITALSGVDPEPGTIELSIRRTPQAPEKGR